MLTRMQDTHAYKKGKHILLTSLYTPTQLQTHEYVSGYYVNPYTYTVMHTGFSAINPLHRAATKNIPNSQALVMSATR